MVGFRALGLRLVRGLGHQDFCGLGFMALRPLTLRHRKGGFVLLLPLLYSCLHVVLWGGLGFRV